MHQRHYHPQWSARPIGMRGRRRRGAPGALVDVMFSEHRDMAAAKVFFEQAKMVTGVTPDTATALDVLEAA